MFLSPLGTGVVHPTQVSVAMKVEVRQPDTIFNFGRADKQKFEILLFSVYFTFRKISLVSRLVQ